MCDFDTAADRDAYDARAAGQCNMLLKDGSCCANEPRATYSAGPTEFPRCWRHDSRGYQEYMKNRGWTRAAL